MKFLFHAQTKFFFNLAFVVDAGRGNPNKNKSGLSYARYRNTILRMNAGLVA